jgi:hypothetical protein
MFNRKLTSYHAGAGAQSGHIGDNMEKYSKEWKYNKGVWTQKHGEMWKIHYIEYNTEYAHGKYFTRKDAEVAAREMKGGSIYE